MRYDYDLRLQEAYYFPSSPPRKSDDIVQGHLQHGGNFLKTDKSCLNSK